MKTLKEYITENGLVTSEHRLGPDVSWGKYRDGKFFVCDHRKHFTKDVDSEDEAKKLAEEWKKMSDSERDSNRKRHEDMIKND